MIRACLWASLLAGCLSEPERPHGDGPPIAAGSILRHRSVVGDLNADGYDDLVLFGNEGAPGAAPTVFVWFGGETLLNPDVRLDLTVADPPGEDPTRWYEALAASIYVSPDGKTRGIAIASAQDPQVMQPDGPSNRFIYMQYVPFDGRHAQPREVDPDRAQTETGGFAPDAPSDFVIVRDTARSFPARQLLFGNADLWSFNVPLEAGAFSNRSSFTVPDSPFYIQDGLALPWNGASQDLLVTTVSNAYRTTGDPDPDLAVGTGAPLAGGGNDRRHLDGRPRGDHFFAVDHTDRNNAITVIDVPPSGPPVTHGFDGARRVEDLAIGDLGGGDEIDLAAITSGTVGVFRDIHLMGDATAATDVLGSREVLSGYDLVAVGNFHGSAQLEIYAISSTSPAQPLRCFHLDGDKLAPCD